ncbi:MAG: arginase family protein [Chloroflexaceae bacterium]|jgi:arginase|nr:arginase family protein [Chloroflexaceae bacterium]
MIQLIGVPYDLNRYNQRMGRTPGLLLPLLTQQTNLALAEPVLLDSLPTSGDERADVGQIMQQLGQRVQASLAQGHFPLIIGGDCTASLGAMAGLGDAASIVWIDAHGDFNTPETSPSGYLGGMPLAVLAGRGLPELRRAAGLAEPIAEERIVLLGTRDLDPLEREALDHSAVAHFTTEQLRHASDQLDAALARVATHGPVYLHVDVDVLASNEVPGVIYPTPGGLSRDELAALLKRIRRHCTIAALTLTAFNASEETTPQALRVASAALDAAVG